MLDTIYFQPASILCHPAYNADSESGFVVRLRERQDSVMSLLGFNRGGSSSFSGSCCILKDYRIYYNFSPQTSVRETPPASALALSTAPNPASSEAILDFALPNDAIVSLRVFDVLGNMVMQPLVGVPIVQGDHSLRLNLATLSSGSYRLRLDAISAKGTDARVVQLLVFK